MMGMPTVFCKSRTHAGPLSKCTTSRDAYTQAFEQEDILFLINGQSIRASLLRSVGT